MDTGKDQQPREPIPRVLNEGEVREAQQEALVLLAGRFETTPIGRVFTDERFTGTREYKTGMSRNYTANRTADDYGDEITLTATIKRSDHSKGEYAGDIIRIRRPSSLSNSKPVFEHKTLNADGTTRQTAEANTDVNVESGLKEIRRISKMSM